MASAVVSGCEGFGLGFQYAFANGKAEEVRQGKNEYIAAVYLTGGIACLCALVEKVATAFFFGGVSPWSLSILCNAAPLLWLPIGILLASVKHGHFKNLVEYFPKTLGKILPRSLGQRTVRVLNFITNNISTCIKVAMVVGIAALAHFGFVAFSCVFAGTWLFHEIDIRGYLPRKISLFAETYFPLVANACLLVCGGTLILRAFSAINLLTTFPFMNQFMTHKVDAIARYFSSAKGISLAEFEAPLIQKQELSHEEINAILDGEEEDYEINPAHCPKYAIDFDSFPKDYNFDKLLKMFNPIQWDPNIVKRKLGDDERFLDHLKETYPGKDPKEQYELLAKDPSNDAFFINWMKKEFNLLIKALKGEVRPQGEQKDLAVGIDYCAMILAHLQKPSLSRVDKEDILLKLAIEAGGYCCRGIKRASGEIVDEAVIPSDDGPDLDDPQKNFERKTRQNLQNRRRGIVQSYYQAIAERLRIPDVVSQDVHGFDIYRKFLSLGFYPLTPLERKQIDLAEIAVWNMYSGTQKNMLLEYRYSLDGVLLEHELQFANYMRQYISSNSKLTQPQKERLIEKYTECNDGKWTFTETIQKFHRIMLVKLGVLRRASKLRDDATKVRHAVPLRMKA